MLFLVTAAELSLDWPHQKRFFFQINSYRCTLLHTGYEVDHITLIPHILHGFLVCMLLSARKLKVR